MTFRDWFMTVAGWLGGDPGLFFFFFSQSCSCPCNEGRMVSGSVIGFNLLFITSHVDMAVATYSGG